MYHPDAIWLSLPRVRHDHFVEPVHQVPTLRSADDQRQRNDSGGGMQCDLDLVFDRRSARKVAGIRSDAAARRNRGPELDCIGNCRMASPSLVGHFWIGIVNCISKMLSR